jgi:hypothetical protein
VIGVDTAEGLSPTTRDASVAQVFRIYPNGTSEQVAQFYGWISPHLYTDEVKKLAVFYNNAMVVPEATGVGLSVIERLIRQLGYYNVYEDTNRADMTSSDMSARFGLRTSSATKPMMVAAAQRLIHQGLVTIRDEYTVVEMQSFEQVKSDTGRSVGYEGVEGSRDDRVMAFALLAYVLTHHLSIVYTLTGSTPTQHVQQEEEPYELY